MLVPVLELCRGWSCEEWSLLHGVTDVHLVILEFHPDGLSVSGRIAPFGPSHGPIKLKALLQECGRKSFLKILKASWICEMESGFNGVVGEISDVLIKFVPLHAKLVELSPCFGWRINVSPIPFEFEYEFFP